MSPERASLLLHRFGILLILLALLIRFIFVVQTGAPVIQARLTPHQDIYPSSFQKTVEVDWRQPSLGDFGLSPDSKIIRFQSQMLTSDGFDTIGGSYLYDRETGSIQTGDLPQVEEHFIFEDGRVVARVNGHVLQPPLTPEGLIVYEAAYSPDGQRMAFINKQEPGPSKLFALSWYTPASAILEEPYVADIAWSPRGVNGPLEEGRLDGAQLAYIAPRAGVDQLFLCTIGGECPQQLTFDYRKKGSPVWSPDGQWIAYLAYRLPETGEESQPFDPYRPSVPASGPLDQYILDGYYGDREIYLISSNGQHLKRLTENDLYESKLEWIDSSALHAKQPGFRSEIIYRSWPQLPFYSYSLPFFSWLYHIPDPMEQASGKSPLRLFPPVAVDQFECPRSISDQQKGLFSISVSNTGWAPTSVRVMTRIATDPTLLFSGKVSQVREEQVHLAAGEQRNVQWELPVPLSPVSYAAVFIDQGGLFPFSATSCQVIRRWLGIPLLPWLRSSLSLLILGLIATIPWSLRKRSVWLWMMKGFLILLFIVSIFVEVFLLPNASMWL